MSSDAKFTAKCFGAIALLDLALKLKMSSLRTGGAIGEGDVTSFFEKMHTVQLLTAANAPVHGLLMLFNLLKARASSEELTPTTKKLFMASIASLYIFALRSFDFKVNAKGYNMTGKPGDGVLSIFGAIGATGGYIAQAALATKLLL